MASGGRREFYAERVSDEELLGTGREREDGRRKARWSQQDCGREERERRRPSPRKREFVPPARTGEKREVYVKGQATGRGRGADTRESGGSFQLKPTDLESGCGGERSQPSYKKRQFRERSEHGGNYGRTRAAERKPKYSGSGGSLRREQEGKPGSGKKRGEGEGRLLEQFRKYEEKVSHAVQNWKGERDGYANVEALGSSLWSLYQRVLDESVEQALQEDLGSRVWRCVHYPIIETLRRQSQRGGGTEEGTGGSPEEEGGELLTAVLGRLLEQYEALLVRLQERHGFQLEQLLNARLNFQQSRRHRREVMLALIPCHLCYVYLGDLSRYQQQLATPPNWARPRSYYLKAIQLYPKSGRPYNQLAVIAVNAQRRLDAVYYYMRSLSAKNPFQSAHDRLVVLFEETCRKEVKAEQEREKERGKLRKEALRRKKREERKREIKRKEEEREKGRDRREIEFHSGSKEVWVVPGSKEWYTLRRGRGGGQAEKKEDGERGENEEGVNEDSYSEPEGELVRNLTSAFLVVHGKLFTKIGIDQMDSADVRLLELWRRALGGPLDLEAGRRMVKMSVINICSIHQGLKTSDSLSGQHYYCNLAFHVALHLTRELVTRCGALLPPALECGVAAEPVGGMAAEDLGSEEEEEGEKRGAAQRDGEGRAGADESGLAGSGEDSWSTSLADGTSTSSNSDTGSEVRPSEAGNVTFDLNLLSEEQLCCLEGVSMMLPAVRAWVDWLAGQEDFWLPFLSPQNKEDLGAFLVSLARLVDSCLTAFDICASKSAATDSKSGWAGLWEDSMLMGFMPLKASVSTETSLATPTLYRLTHEQRRRQDLMRLVLLSFTSRKLSGHAHFNKRTQEDVHVEVKEEEESGDDVEVEGYSEEEEEELDKPEEREGERGEEREEEREGEREEEATDDTILEIEKLKAQRDQLSLEIRAQSVAITTAQTVLREAVSVPGEETVVCARYLVPDTNCFVDLLSCIRSLVQCGHFVVAVPLVVIAELEGLSKGAGDGGEERERKDGRGKKVMADTRLAVEYIRSAMGHGLKVLTTRGSLLTSLSFTAEVTGKASNDDLILQSSLSLHHRLDASSSASSAPSSSSPLHTVVLLTDDRNLRVKAHVAGLPVKDIPQFMDISGLSVN